ncbi:MAG: hypothetical protein RIS88_2253 [Pseudomonadota bacterium]|jgi:hypothetical protein
MTTFHRCCIAPVLVTALGWPSGQALANPVETATPAPVHRAQAAPVTQRLAWRITELEGELAALQRFAQQQDASLHQLESALDASEARLVRENLTLAVMWALVAGWAAWRAVRRPRR